MMQYFFKMDSCALFKKNPTNQLVYYLHYPLALKIQQFFKPSLRHLKLLSLDRNTDSLNYTLLPPY